jgi:hypothetical protein
MPNTKKSSSYACDVALNDLMEQTSLLLSSPMDTTEYFYEDDDRGQLEERIVVFEDPERSWIVRRCGM